MPEKNLIAIYLEKLNILLCIRIKSIYISVLKRYHGSISIVDFMTVGVLASLSK
jgi:hypothetical protein